MRSQSSVSRVALAFFATLFILVFPISASQADDQTTTPPTPASSDAPQPSWYDRWFNSFENMRDRTSHDYVTMVRSIDHYFSGEKIEETSNGSYVKLELLDTLATEGDQRSDIRISAKVDLPGTEKRFKFIFNTDPDENRTLDQKVIDNATGQRLQGSNSIAGLEYTNTDKSGFEWQHGLSGGVKLRFNPIPFVRYQLGKKWQLDDNWTSEFHQSFWDYRDIGSGATTRVDFIRPLGSHDQFKIESQAEYRDQYGRYDYAQTFSDIHTLDRTSSLTYWTGALASTQPTSEVTTYLLGVKYRRTLYRDWFLLTLSPLLSFPREDHWEATPSFTLDFQIYFTE